MMVKHDLVVGEDYAVHRHAITDKSEVIGGHVLDTAATVERLVGTEALARQLRALIAKVKAVPPFGPAMRVRVLAVGLPFGVNRAPVGVRVSAKTFNVRHCLCPNCGNDHREGNAGVEEYQPHYEESAIEFIVQESSLISRWKDYAVPGFGHIFEKVGWEEVPA